LQHTKRKHSSHLLQRLLNNTFEYLRNVPDGKQRLQNLLTWVANHVSDWVASRSFTGGLRHCLDNLETMRDNAADDFDRVRRNYFAYSAAQCLLAIDALHRGGIGDLISTCKNKCW
jgi:hypothetical protein